MKPKRFRGQHFLVDRNMLNNIIAAAEIAPVDTVVEIGAGTGNLTALLAKRARRVIAIEIDKDLIPSLVKRFCHSNPAQPGRNLQGFTPNEDPSTSLRSTRDDTEVHRVKCGNIEIIHDDARTFNPTTYNLQPTSYSVVANIPYNITSLIIRRLLEAVPAPSKMILLIQKEVAERICAKPPAMSLLSVAVQYYAQPRILFSVPRTCFSPRPNVDSAIVSFRRENGDSHRFCEEERCKQYKNGGCPHFPTAAFFRILHAGFAHKRKLLISNLASVISAKAGIQTRDIFHQLDIPLTARAQELSVAQWEELCCALFPFSEMGK